IVGHSTGFTVVSIVDNAKRKLSDHIMIQQQPGDEIDEEEQERREQEEDEALLQEYLSRVDYKSGMDPTPFIPSVMNIEQIRIFLRIDSYGKMSWKFLENNIHMDPSALNTQAEEIQLLGLHVIL